jgi:iron complex outermembrane receptor protein
MAYPLHFVCRVISMLCLWVALGPSSSAAQSPSGPPVKDTSDVEWQVSLPPLTVTASRLSTSPAKAPARVTVLDSSALHTTGASSVADLFDDRAALHVRRYGTGGLATPALRGAGASQTTVLLDGQPITDPQIGHLDLSVLPTVLLRSVQVMHGPASALHGSGSLGGAIQLRTLRPRSSVTTRLVIGGGAFGARQSSLLVGAPLSDATSVLAAVDYQSTEGDFPYTDESRFPAETVRRRNADRTHWNLYGSVRSQLGDHTLRLSGSLTDVERGLPPTSSTAPAQERQWDTQLRLWGSDRIQINKSQLTVRGLAQRTRLRYADPTQDLDQTGRTVLTSLETTLRRPVSDQWMAIGGASGSYAQAQHPNLEASAHQEHAAFFAEGTGDYGRLTFYPAVRTDAYWMPNGVTRVATNPRLGLNWQPVRRWPTLHVKAQVGRAFRVPTFNDRYWQPGGTPDLRPERSWGGDLGVYVGQNRKHIELTAFGHWHRDQIVWEPTGQGYWSPTNVARVRTVGLEFSAVQTWTPSAGPDVQTGLTYTLTDARTRTDPNAASYNEPLRYVPRDQFKPYMTLTWGPVALDLHARYTARRPVTSDGSQYLDPYALVDTQLRLSHSIGGFRGEVSAKLENALNTDYQSVGGRPMPPRHVHLRLHLAL